jgi:hypothetical protein
MVRMIIEIETQFLLDNKITAHQYLIAKLVNDNKIPTLKKYIVHSNTLNDLPRDLSQLKAAGFLSSTFNPGNYINLETLAISPKFTKASTFTDDPFDEFYAVYPIKALRTDGMYDYLRVDQDKCRKLYHNIVRVKPSVHKHIIKCLRSEIQERELKGSMTFMKRMPAWLTSESWKIYEDRVDDDSGSTQEEKRKAYGTDIE